MAHLHHRHAGAVPVEHLVAGARQHSAGQHGRPGAEVEDAATSMHGGRRLRAAAAGPRAARRSPPLPPLPLPPLPLPSRSRSSMRSRPASFSPSPRLISVTPCVERPISRIYVTRVRISTPPVEISMISSSVVDQRRGDHLAVALRGLDRDHALRAAAVARVLGDRRALAVAVLGRGQHRLRLVFGDQHADHPLPLAEASCRARRAPCGPSAARRSRRSAPPCRRRRTASRRACRRSARRRSGSRPRPGRRR